IYNTYGKENTEKGEDVKGMYILLSGTLAVVTSAVIEVLQTCLLYMIDVVYIQRPILWYGYNPTVHRCQCLDKVLFLFSWMTCAIKDLLLLKENCLLRI